MLCFTGRPGLADWRIRQEHDEGSTGKILRCLSYKEEAKSELGVCEE